jgi:hypothetical protein
MKDSRAQVCAALEIDFFWPVSTKLGTRPYEVLLVASAWKYVFYHRDLTVTQDNIASP